MERYTPLLCRIMTTCFGVIKKRNSFAKNSFARQPNVKGVIEGQLGNRVWAIWTHRFYGDPGSVSSGNTLYILRLVIENQAAGSSISSGGREAFDARQWGFQAEQLKAVLESAQTEAADWGLLNVKLWHPTPVIEELIE
jgi:hypothetical protein